ncbi:cell division protein FtsQ/DivIB [Bacillus thermotolerans]|nr:FtsQ-type POTRA domain-containing protein [Bacillus thermotolerans]KKB39259.1 Cell division protein FtsQ [Bacillus thermotolerans]KKB43923.1 Cell division protein FtsQ [Bacillus thermotolerans]
MERENMVSIEDRIPKLKKLRKRKTNRRLIFIISLFFLIILVIIYFQSPLSKIHSIKVEGNELIPTVEVLEKSGLKENQGIWESSLKQAEKKLEQDERIQEADISIGFPNRLNISVTEQRKMAYLSDGETLYPVLNNGAIIKEATGGPLEQLPILHNFEAGKVLDRMMTSLEELPPEVRNAISEIYYVPKKNDNLRIQLFMNDGFEVSANLKTFSEKMVYYPEIASQLDPDVKGIIDLQVGSYFRAYPSERDEMTEEAPPEH